MTSFVSQGFQRVVAGTFAGLLLAFAPVAIAAPEPGALELKSEVFEEVVVVDKNGKQQKKLQALARAVPGKEVVYFITYHNKGSKPAESVVVNNPVPAGLLFSTGSTKVAGTRDEVSVDGGQTFGVLEKLTVPAADGKPRAANASDVTHLRWTVLAPVKPGGEGKVSYRAFVK